MTELDYSGLIKDDASGAAASWESVISACLEKDAIDLDEKTLLILERIATDPARLAEFYERAERQPGTSSTRDRVTGLLRALEAVAEFVRHEDPARLEGIYDNMADAVSHLSPESVAEVLELGRDPASPHASFVREVTRRITAGALARFVARSVATDRSCTARLAGAFRALVPDPKRRESVAALTRQELERTPLAGEPDFALIWSDTESLLFSYSDQKYISDDYDREMARAQSRAEDGDQITDDPPERIAAWLTTISDVSIRALDLQLMADLLVTVGDSARREELLQLVVSQVDGLVTLGDFDAANRLVSSMIALAARPEAADAAAQVARAIDQIAGGTFMSSTAVHLNAITDEEFEPVKQLCAAIGPALVPTLTDSLLAETGNRGRQRLAQLLVGFGAHGRDSAAKLKRSTNSNVRRIAVQLLRAFGGAQALTDLEQLVNDTEPAVQRDAVRAIIGFGVHESFKMLQRILESENHRGRTAAIEELGLTRDQKAAPLFCHLVRHLEPRGALRGTYADSVGRLGVLGGPEAVAALAGVLQKGWWWAPFRTREIRTEAAAALAQIRLPAAQAALADAAANGSFGVRSIARKYMRTP